MLGSVGQWQVAQFLEDDCMMFFFGRDRMPLYSCGARIMGNVGMAVGCDDWVWKGTMLAFAQRAIGLVAFCVCVETNLWVL